MAEVGESLQTAPKRSLLPVGIAVVLSIAAIGIYLQIQSHTTDPGKRAPNKYIFAAGLYGDVRINYEISGAPPLETVDGFRVIRIPASRVTETSSPMLYGTAPDSYFREKPDGTLEPMEKNSIAVRKNGLAGDRNEFYEKTDELIQRDEVLKSEGRLGPDGKPVLGAPYELMVLREPIK